MENALKLKRKNIDLPVDVLQKLSMVAVARGLSLKAYIEQVLKSKADSITIQVTENPSPSSDAWFDDPRNIQMVNEGVSQYKRGELYSHDMDEIRNMLGK